MEIDGAENVRLGKVWGMPASDWMNCILLERHDAVFVEIPKVACTSIKTILAGLVGLSLEEFGGNPHDLPWPMARPVPGAGPLFPGRFAFAFVRNPWERLVSCYRDKIGGEVDGFTFFTVRPGVADCLERFDAFFGGMSFEEFVGAVASIDDADADTHFRSQHCFVTSDDGRLAVDFVGRYERLADDFREVQERVGLPAVELPRLQAARQSRPYASFYTDETRRIVAERYGRDIEMFGYSFDEN
jgi:chondroitin 4-sulfotransferase 11